MKRAVLIRLGTGVFVLFAILAALLEISRHDEIVIRPAPVTSDASDPLRAQLQRCQTLGETALEDSSCLNAWDENRRRFLNSGSAEDGSE